MPPTEATHAKQVPTYGDFCFLWGIFFFVLGQTYALIVLGGGEAMYNITHEFVDDTTDSFKDNLQTARLQIFKSVVQQMNDQEKKELLKKYIELLEGVD